jgi:uncharacterized protein with FMN-binding domain
MNDSSVNDHGDQRQPGTNEQTTAPNPQAQRVARGAVPGPRMKAKPGGSRKLSRGLATLSAAAIVTVYGVGYIRTQAASPQDTSRTTTMAAAPRSLPTEPVAQLVPPGAVVPARPSATMPATRTPQASPTSPAAQASRYKDGTYIGAGSSRHGGIQAQVVVKDGQIVSASITRATTRYPTSAIRALPATVVSTQSTDVNVVSGATDSSNAYLDAVDNALAKAS